MVIIWLLYGYYIVIIWLMMVKKSGWWLTYPSEKYEFVSWDDDIPNIRKNKVRVPNHQPDMFYKYWSISFGVLHIQPPGNA